MNVPVSDRPGPDWAAVAWSTDVVGFLHGGDEPADATVHGSALVIREAAREIFACAVPSVAPPAGRVVGLVTPRTGGV